ncbi:uncharacterized protein LOC116252654 [Nymphaea colorata]|nr:uncharacterized protein LOC116252654 [Nymphaea colorata]
MMLMRPSSGFGATVSCGSSLSSASSSSSTSPLKRRLLTMTRSSIRIAVVGDVHDDWDLQEDGKALQFLQPDLVLFTGDFGNENVDLVRSIAGLKFPKAAILGNHDCWYTRRFSMKGKDRVKAQLECLGEEHVGYRRIDFPGLKLSIVGGRPFSCGGDVIFRPELISARYGVHDMKESARKICQAAIGTPEGHSIIFLAHNGPTGLGSQISAICGRDWVLEGGDHGDPDLAQAISDLKEGYKLSIPLVIFGHMHKQLAYRRGLRKMVVHGTDGIIYLNGAVVPRVKRLMHTQEASISNSATTSSRLTVPKPRGSVREFTVVEMLDGKLVRAAESWVSVTGDATKLEEEYVFYNHVEDHIP